MSQMQLKGCVVEQSSGEKYISIEQAASNLGVSTWVIYDRMNSGVLSKPTVNGKLVVRERELAEKAAQLKLRRKRRISSSSATPAPAKHTVASSSEPIARLLARKACEAKTDAEMRALLEAARIVANA